jgi:prophage tail gpP-like protein/murein DD-endopeptidase MepM/ murein hydrolase activator NlpD
MPGDTISGVNPASSLIPGNLRASLQTEWGRNEARRYRTFRGNIESYFIDNAMDNDADSWQIVLGDPDADMIALLKRDAEVIASIYGLGAGRLYLGSGIADTIGFNTDGIWTIAGRDISAVATDSIAKPQQFNHARAAKIIARQARELKIGGRLHLAPTKVYKREYTDGSETYWEFWYRILRKDKMWLWAGPDGSLNSGKLSYDDSPSYYLGTPSPHASEATRRYYQPVLRVEITKDTQGRVGEIWINGSRGDKGFIVTVTDPTTHNWLKRPRKIIQDSQAQNRKQAVRLAWEEIFESKVGELELKVTIADPTIMIRTDRIAHVRVPQMKINDEFYVVGIRAQADSGGLVQEVRLRQKQYAISRRVPSDPKLGDQPGKKQLSGLGVALGQRWGDFFVTASRKFHGPWNWELFLACLLGICDQETGFNNFRRHGGPGQDYIEWHPPPDLQPATPVRGHPSGQASSAMELWKLSFANEKGDGYVTEDYAVGPMQLLSSGYKHWADDYLRPNFHNEFQGGRWHPQWNIMAAARAFREKLDQFAKIPKDANIWIGVRAYNGSGPAAQAYADAVRVKVLKTPGYLAQVQQALDQAKAAQKAAQQDGGATSGIGGKQPVGSGPLGKGFPYQKNIIGRPGQGTHSYSEPPNNWQSDNAVDISCRKGTPVFAVHDGVLGNYGVLPGSGTVVVNPSGGGRFDGNRINIIGRNQSTYYAHLTDLDASLKVYGRQGMRIKAGQLLGWSGVANGVQHLHFACQNGSPFQFIPGGDPH